MYRAPPSRLGVDENDLADLDNRLARFRAIDAPPVLDTVLDLPLDLRANANDMAAVPPLDVSSPSAQIPYTHLSYGPEREAIVIQNLHMSHLELLNQQLNAQSALTNTRITQMQAYHQQTLNQLISELQSSQMQITIRNWHQATLNHDLGNPTTDIKEAADLTEKFTDLRSTPISRLAGVEAAESASEPGIKTQLQPAVSTILGIEGGQGGAGAGAGAAVGKLYGAEEDVAVFLEGFGCAADADDDDESGTTGVTILGADGVEVEDGAGSGVGSVVAGDAEGEDMGREDGLVEVDACCAAFETVKPRNRLLSRLKKIFRI